MEFYLLQQIMVFINMRIIFGQLEYLSGFNSFRFNVLGDSDIFSIVGSFNNTTKELEESRIYRNNSESKLILFFNYIIY